MPAGSDTSAPEPAGDPGAAPDTDAPSGAPAPALPATGGGGMTGLAIGALVLGLALAVLRGRGA